MTSSSRRVSIAALILEGMHEALSLGASRETVRAHLGYPEDIGQGAAKVEIDRYLGGSLEVSYFNDATILIAVYLSNSVSGDKSQLVPIGVDVPEPVLNSEHSLVEWLARNKLSCALVLDDEGQRLWKAESGTALVYRNGALKSIQVAAHP